MFFRGFFGSNWWFLSFNSLKWAAKDLSFWAASTITKDNRHHL
jgi:hypothetical protein